MQEAFAKCHPVINFLFFAGAVVLGVCFLHPYFLMCSAGLAALYYLLLNKGRKKRFFFGILAVSVVIVLLNPLFNANGATVLFCWAAGRPYTLEALLYGAAAGSMFFSVMLWFACWQRVMSGDRLLCVFGRLAPAASLLLTMVFRLLPYLQRKAKEIAAAARCAGSRTGSRKQRLQVSAAELSALTSFALEGSQITADAMKSRGYGSGKRTSFARFRVSAADAAALAYLCSCLVAVAVGAAFGKTAVSFSPRLFFARSGAALWLSLGGCAAFLLFPSILQIKEDILWSFFRSKI
ncbi:MAG: energy-coupling factor transporter transmembrane protein EcfT [Oscillospiraceae bacterium]|jgi:energy-coupling factor transport system permease protein|nr:energy-coupling factor transporter transmembrane protein EcfT [Oscillospiraceae bacterium]